MLHTGSVGRHLVLCVDGLGLGLVVIGNAKSVLHRHLVPTFVVLIGVGFGLVGLASALRSKLLVL